jgi:polyribonucleotide nucleotidyltransferase
VGQVYHGKVVSILDFGAFIEIMPGKEGLLHVSEIAWTKTEKVEDVLAVGDEVDVKLLEYDPKAGKMRLSMRALTEKPEGYVEPKPRSNNGPRRDSKDGGRRDSKDGGNRGGQRRDGNRGPRRDNNK